MNDPYRLRYTNQLVGAFLLVLLLFLLIMSIMFFQTRDFFGERHFYWVDVAQQEVQGLQKGSEVLILGERAGVVESIRYIDGTSNVRVTLAIRRIYSEQIFLSSIVALQRRYGVGPPILVIRRGMPADGVLTPLPPGSRIRDFEGEEDRLDQLAREVESVSESIGRIQVAVDPAMSKVGSSAETFEKGIVDDASPAFNKMGIASDAFLQTNEQLRPEASQTMLEIRTSTAHLDRQISQLTEKMEQLVEADMRDTLKDIRQSSDDVSQAAGSVDTAANDVNRDVAGTLVEIRQAADKMQRLADESRDVVRVVRRESDDLPGTVQQFNATVNNAQDMVSEIRSHWLLRRYTDQRTSTRQVSPSGIRAGACP